MPVEKCAYCLARDATTREHVIARGFFERQPLDNLTVPTCMECNSGTGDGINRPLSQDEEYVRTIFAWHAGSWGHTGADELVQGKIARSFARRPDGLPKMLARSMRLRGVEQPGLWFPGRSTMMVDGARIVRVLRKVTKGLFYVHNQFPLPADCDVFVDFLIPPQDVYNMLEIFKLCSHTYPSIRGDGVFWHVGARDPTNPTTTLWLTIFYERLASLTVTAHRNVSHIGFRDPNQSRPLMGIDLDRRDVPPLT